MAKRRTRQMVQYSLEQNIKEYNRMAIMQEQLKNDMTNVKDNILVDMDELGIQKEQTEEFGTFSIVEAYERTGVDAKLLEKRFKTIYEKVKKITVVSRNLKVTKPKKKEDK